MRLCRGELLVELPLQPAVEIDRVGIPFDEAGDTRSVGMPQRLRPPMPVTAVFFGQRRPGSEVVERAALAVAKRGVGQPTPLRSWNRMQQLERLPLGRPCAVAVDGVKPAGPLLDV